MKFCDHHWGKLRQAIVDRGLAHLIKSAEENMESMASEIEGNGPTTFDPLMTAHWMICGTAIERGGVYMMTGDYCPVCEALEHTQNPVDHLGQPMTREQLESWWIDGPSDAVHKQAVSVGLIKEN